MQLTKHAIKRIIQRNKAASFMTVKALQALVDKADRVTNHAEGISAIMLKTIDLVLIHDDSTGNVLTCYRFIGSKFEGVKVC